MPFKFFSKEGFERVTALANQDVELNYKQFIADITGISATTEGTAVTIISSDSITFDGQTRVQVEFFAPAGAINTSGAAMAIILFRDSTVIGRTYLYIQSSSFDVGPIKLEAFDTPSAGAHTYTIKAYVSSNSGTIHAGSGGAGSWAPAFLRTTRVTQQVTTFPEAVMEVADGDVPVWDSASQSWKGKGGQVLLWDSVEAAVALPAASITTPSLSQIFKHLRVIWEAEIDTGGPDLMVRVNGDAGTNYDSAIGGWANAAFYNGGYINNGIKFGYASAGAATFGGAGSFDIHCYSDATRDKRASGTYEGHAGTGAAAMQMGYIGGQWRPASPAAITTLTFIPSSGNWAAGTRFSVYGIG
jgi:hypothetical protein